MKINRLDFCRVRKVNTLGADGKVKEILVDDTDYNAAGRRRIFKTAKGGATVEVLRDRNGNPKHLFLSRKQRATLFQLMNAAAADRL